MIDFPILDSLTSLAWAFSTRALRSAYTGHVIQLRRSSDNATRDFDASASLASQIAAWAGSGDAFVTIWYDQSGNGLHASQADTTMQPPICTAGVVNLVGGVPAPNFIGGTGLRRVLVGAAANLYASGAGSSVAVVTGNHQGSTAVFGKEGDSGTSQYVYGQQITGYTLTTAIRNAAGTFEQGAGTVAEIPSAFPVTQASRFTILDNGAVMKKRVRGTALADVAYTRSGSHTFTQNFIGAPSTTGTGWSGSIAELIAVKTVWDAPTLLKVENSQTNYFKIPA
ncbi:arabinofuranosidase catalytic domain-containing protein [Subtercola sp. YIM 133946]